MDKKSAIFTRRSIRVYDPSKRATKEQILDILDAAMHAPTAMNKQPWEFVVATDPEVVNAITKIHPYCRISAGRRKRYHCMRKPQRAI